MDGANTNSRDVNIDRLVDEHCCDQGNSTIGNLVSTLNELDTATESAMERDKVPASDEEGENGDEEIEEALKRNIDGDDNGAINDSEDEDDDDNEGEPSAAGLNMQERHVKAKSCVSLSLNAGGKATSNVWKWFYKCEVPSMEKRDALLEHEPGACANFYRANWCEMFCCKICYDNPTMSLQCACKRLKNNHPGNAARHITSSHSVTPKDMNPIPNKAKRVSAVNPEDEPEFTCRQELIARGVVNSISVAEPPKKRSKGATDCNSTITTGTGTLPGLPAHPVHVDVCKCGGTPDSKATNGSNYFAEHRAIGAKGVIDKWHKLTIDFSSAANVAQRQFTSKDCPAFRDLMNFTIKHASTISNVKEKDRFMGQRKFTIRRFTNFEEFISAVNASVAESRAYYFKATGKRVRFVNYAHDNWSGKYKEKLGVSVMFHNPVRQETYSIAIGLCHCPNHSAVATVAAIRTCTNLYGINDQDMGDGQNDNAAPAAATTNIISGDSDGCHMHRLELMMEHALGIKTRSSNGQIVDSNQDAERVRMYVNSFIQLIMDGRSKHFKEHVELMRSQGRNCIVFKVPSATRVSGVHSMYQCMVKSRWNLEYLYRSEGRPKWVDKGVLTNDQFKEIAQMESVLSHAAGLSMLVQADQWGSLAHTTLRSLRVHVIYHTKTLWDVARVDMHQNTTNQWNGSCNFPLRPLSPRISVAQSERPTTNEVQLAKVKYEDLMATPRDLIKRMQKESSQYCYKVTERQLLALACHPLAATLGIIELEELTYYLTKKGKCDTPLQNWKPKAMQVLTKKMKEVFSAKLRDDEVSEEDVVPKKAKALELDDDWAAVMATKKKAPAVNTTGCKVKTEVEKFFKQSIDWPQQLEDQGVGPDIIKSIGEDEADWQANYELIASHFDVFEWWHREGKIKFKMIFIVACTILSLPESNGRQERVFSGAGWIDAKLSNRQAEVTFEMKALLYSNRVFIECARRYQYDSQKKLAAEATRKMLAIAEANRKPRDDGESDNEEDNEDGMMSNHLLDEMPQETGNL